MEGRDIHIVGIAGSLRRNSYNKRLLAAAAQLAPPGMEIEAVDIAPIPFFNADVEAEGDPPAVHDLKERVRRSDGVLIVTPEYNYSIPGVLKNALDWASRPPQRVLRHKPIALMGATTGLWGTTRAQEDLRIALVYTQSYVLPGPEVLVASVRNKFDESGGLIDDTTRQFVRDLLEKFADWIRLVSREPAAAALA